MPSDGILATELDELYREAAAGQKRGEKVGLYRKILAYGLKIIAAGGSLIVATNEFPEANKYIGMSILISVFIDGVTSNHKRLISEVEAGYAFRSLRSQVKRGYNGALGILHRTLDINSDEFKKEETALMVDAHEKLSKGIEDITVNREAADVEALKRLSLDQERSEVGA